MCIGIDARAPYTIFFRLEFSFQFSQKKNACFLMLLYLQLDII